MYRLLIINGHESHISAKFQDCCKKKNIITLCMPPHSSHLLQPLDVACFAPLKRAYGDAISALARNRIYHINKESFLPAFQEVFPKVFTTQNVCAGFRGAGLVPFNPEAIILKLDVRLRTPTPAPRDTSAWEAKTPRNAVKMEEQTRLVQMSMQKYHGSPASSIDKKVAQLTKGAQQMAHEMVLMREEIVRLRDAAEATAKRKSRKRRYIREEETLTVGQVVDLIAVQGESSRDSGEQPAKRVRTQRRCGRCGETGHNSRTCTVEIEGSDDSDTSIEYGSIE